MKVSQLFLYPVKSLGGIHVQKAKKSARGFQYDRRWMLVDAEGLFMTQRKTIALSKIKVALHENSLQLYSALDKKGIQVPLEPKEGQKKVQVKVWDSICTAIGGYVEANIWLKNQLSIDCRLVYMPEDSKRLINSPLVPDDSIVSFADGYPFLVIGTASLDDLNRRLETPVSINRFRPNIVIDTMEPFEEDDWKAFQIGDVSFLGVKPCARCIMVNVDAATTTSGKEPLKTLATFRKNGNKVMFGMNVIGKGEGNGDVVRVGDFVVLG